MTAAAPASPDLYRVHVRGIDYFNPVTNQVESGGKESIAMWMLDPDYDGKTFFARQAFFPGMSAREARRRLKKTLRTEIDPNLIEDYRGLTSFPFEPGRRVAVKVIDDRGIESIRVLDVREEAR